MAESSCSLFVGLCRRDIRRTNLGGILCVLLGGEFVKPSLFGLKTGDVGCEEALRELIPGDYTRHWRTSAH